MSHLESLKTPGLPESLLRSTNEVGITEKPMGHALKKTKRASPHSEDLVKFMYQLYNQGMNGPKYEASDVVELIQKARNPDNNTKRFWSDDYLDEGQVKALFGTFTANIKKGKPARRFLTACVSSTTTDDELTAEEAIAPVDDVELEEGIITNALTIRYETNAELIRDLNEIESDNFTCPLLVRLQIICI